MRAPMSYTLIDLTRLLTATALLGPLLGLAGVALAEATDLLGFRTRAGARRYGVALLAAFALLPALASTVTRFAGLGSALVLTLGLAVLGGASIVRRRPAGVSLGAALALLGWLALVALETVDFDTGRALYQSYTVIDMVKHAATVRAIVDTGAPPADPFFARAEGSGYYYFFYTLGALAQKLAPSLVDARATIGALMVLVGPALHALVVLLLERTGFVSTPSTKASRIVLLLLFVSGLDVLPIALLRLATGTWLPQLDTWNEAVVSFPDALLWVPHHVAAVLAAWVAFLTLVDVAADRERGEPLAARPVLIAALALLSSAGMSVWTTLVAALALALWLARLAFARRTRALSVVACAGVLSLVIGLPHLVDMMNRGDEGFPLALTIRGFDQWDVRVRDEQLRYLGRALLLPLNYALELGLFLLGSVVFWMRRRRAEVPRSELDRLLVLYALAGFLFATFTRSTVLMNDIAWRAPLAFQLTMLVWTAATLATLGARFQVPRLTRRALYALAAVGYVTTLYGLVAQRVYRFVPLAPWAQYVNAHPETDRALREAYERIARELPPDTVTQHNPAPPRVFDFGLYGRSSVAVADRSASLYGASKRAVAARADALEPVFNGTLAAGEVRARAQQEQVDALVVTIDDAPWHDPSSWVWRSRPRYESERVRVIPTEQLAPSPALQAKCVRGPGGSCIQ